MSSVRRSNRINMYQFVVYTSNKYKCLNTKNQVSRGSIRHSDTICLFEHQAFKDDVNVN